MELEVQVVEGLHGCWEENSSPLKELYLLPILSHLSSPEFPILYISGLLSSPRLTKRFKENTQEIAVAETFASTLQHRLRKKHIILVCVWLAVKIRSYS